MKENVNNIYGVIAVILLLALAAIIAIVWSRSSAQNSTATNSSTTSASVSSENDLVAGNFIVSEIEYAENNTWNYVVTGTLPTPCHKFSVDAVVRESFPEQVTLQIHTIEPTGDEACIQIIDEQQVAGSFKASEGATVKLQEIVE